MFESQTPPYHPFIFKTYSILPSELYSQSLAQTDPKLSVVLRKSPSEHQAIVNVWPVAVLLLSCNTCIRHILTLQYTSQITTKFSKNRFIFQTKTKLTNSQWATTFKIYLAKMPHRKYNIRWGGGGNSSTAGTRLSKPLGELQPATITYNFPHIAYYIF